MNAQVIKHVTRALTESTSSDAVAGKRTSMRLGSDLLPLKNQPPPLLEK